MYILGDKERVIRMVKMLMVVAASHSSYLLFQSWNPMLHDQKEINKRPYHEHEICPHYISNFLGINNVVICISLRLFTFT